MAHRVKCYYCGKTFDRDKLPYVQVSAKRYAHQECSLTEEEKRNKEEQDKYLKMATDKNMFELPLIIKDNNLITLQEI